MLRVTFSKSEQIFEHLKKFNISKILVDETILDGFDRSIRYYNVIIDDQTSSGLTAVPEGITIDYVYEIARKREYVVMYDFKKTIINIEKITIIK